MNNIAIFVVRHYTTTSEPTLCISDISIIITFCNSFTSVNRERDPIIISFKYGARNSYLGFSKVFAKGPDKLYFLTLNSLRARVNVSNMVNAQ